MQLIVLDPEERMMRIAGLKLNNREEKNFTKEKCSLNKDKRSQYKLTGSIHTLEIKSPEYEPAQDENVSECITTRINETGTEAVSKINPNKLNGDVFSFSEFRETMQEILSASGVGRYRFTRTDLRLDAYDRRHYRLFSKLNKYLISAIAVSYSTKNNYRAEDLFTGNQISIAVKNDYFEVENYDRNHKNKVTGNTTEQATARLEERTTARQWRGLYQMEYVSAETNMTLLEWEFTKKWASRWQKARKNLQMVQDAYNDALVKKYHEGLNKKPVQFRSLTDFLIQNQESIFTSAQMVDLLGRLGVENPKGRAKYHKKKYGCEYFSLADVDYAIAEIKRATEEYFNS